MTNKISLFLKKAKAFPFWLGRRLFKKHSAGPLAYTNNYKQEQADKNLIYSLSPKKIPNLKQLKHVNKILNRKERRIVRFFLFLGIAALIYTAIDFYRSHLELRPEKGGIYSEALIGLPKYINPLYNYNRDADKDISSLVFSSLFKRNEKGDLKNDLVESYEVSEDGKSYTMKIRSGVKFHTGEELIVDDIIFTFEAIKNPEYNSLGREIFLGVEIEKVDDNTIKFVLGEPYAPFLELLTFGILPQQLWLEINPETAGLAELNLKPVGSGPFKFKSFTKNRDGEVKEYVLEVNEDYYDGRPYLDEIVFKFYPSASEAINALNANAVDGLSYLSHNNLQNVIAKNSLAFNKINSTEVAALFFNKKNNSLLGEKKIREALALALEKEKFVPEVMSDYARVVSGPILPGSFAYNNNLKKYNYDFAAAEKILEDLEYKKLEITQEDLDKLASLSAAEIADQIELSTKNEIKEYASSTEQDPKGFWRVKLPSKKGNKAAFLAVTLSLADLPDNVALGEKIKANWEALGVRTKVKNISPNSIVSETIKPRNFEILLFSQINGHDPDLYVFWHSSQANESGLNIADYKNTDADSALEAGRLSLNQDKRKEQYNKFQEVLSGDLPAIFLYSPTYNYIQTKKIKGLNIKNLVEPQDRFYSVKDWHVNTKKKLIFNK